MSFSCRHSSALAFKADIMAYLLVFIKIVIDKSMVFEYPLFCISFHLEG